MGTFTWIIIIMVIFGVVGKISNKLKESAQREQQAQQTQQTHPDSRPQPNLEGTLQQYRASREEVKESVQRAHYEEARNSVDDREAVSIGRMVGGSDEPNEREAAVPYEREELKPYERKSHTAYQRKNTSPYERKRQLPYGGDNGNHSKSPDFSRLTKEQWTQGIILSEVLGAPRAKRPHRTPGDYHQHTKS